MEPFQPIRIRGVLADGLEQILDRIRSGQILEGDVLPSERLLAAQMEVSRPTVRSVIQRLTSSGVVHVTSGRGGGARVVSGWVPRELEEAASSSLGAERVFALLEARRTLEPRVAQLAALRGTAEDFERMEQAILLSGAQREDVRHADQAESRFHRVMWRAAGNRDLERMMLGLERELRHVREWALTSADDYSAVPELHTATLLALRDGDQGAIEAEMGRHLTHLEVTAQRLLRQRVQRPIPDFLVSH